MTHDPQDIVAWQRLDDRISTSGRLKADDLARLAGMGVRHVINLALTDSPGALADEDKLTAAAGLRYTHIPVPFGAPEEAHLDGLRTALAADDEPVHVHCIMNWRVSAFFYRLNREAGMPEPEARAVMARQWTPEDTDSKDAPVWAAFVRQGEQ